MTPAPAGFTSVVIRGSAWFWGARLLAGAFFSWGVPMTLVESVSWGGAVAAAWILAELAGTGWREAWRLLPAAAIVALPEGVAALADRYATATTLGLRVDAWGALGAVLLRLAAVALLVAALGAVLAWFRRLRLTSAVPRSPT